MLALLLQAATLFPAAPPPVEADAAFHARVVALAAAEEWEIAAVDALRAELDRDAEFAALAELVQHGDSRQVRLSALLAAGAPARAEEAAAGTRGAGREALDHALFVAGCTHSGEAEALACLLAPVEVPTAWWPALLMRAQDPLAELPVRGGALARLLDGGCLEAWPLVRSVLRAGTAIDEPAPWADWKRGGRYELPKRLVVLSLDRLLTAHDGQPCGFEPNASWNDQAEQLAALEARVWIDDRPAPPLIAEREFASPDMTALEKMAQGGDPAARRACSVLLHAAQSGDGKSRVQPTYPR